MTRHFCDRCGDELLPLKCQRVFLTAPVPAGSSRWNPIESKMIDAPPYRIDGELCDSCVDQFTKWWAKK